MKSIRDKFIIQAILIWHLCFKKFSLKTSLY